MNPRFFNPLIGVACTLFQPFACGQEQQSTAMPVAATGIMVQMDKEIIASKKKAAEALEKILRDTTKKGDLAGAMAVKQMIDQLNTEIVAISANKGAARGAQDIIGRWQGQGWSLEFLPNGTVTSSDPGVTGTWTVVGTAVQVSFSNGISHTVERNAEGWAGVFKTGGKPGGAVRYSRIP